MDKEYEVKKLKRLAELMELKNGWLEGEGSAPNAMAFNNAVAISRLLLELNVKHEIYPIPQGGIQFEFNGLDLEVVFDNDGSVKTE